MHDKKLYGTATVGTKGQVVIPVEAREKLNIHVGDKLYVIGSEKGGWAGLVKEDKLAEIVGHLVDNIEVYKDALKESEK